MDPLFRRIQLHPSLYCLMATNSQVAEILDLVAASIEDRASVPEAAAWLEAEAELAREWDVVH